MANRLTNQTELRNRLTAMVAHWRRQASTSLARQSGRMQLVHACITTLESRGTPGPTHVVRIKRFDCHGITFSHRRPLRDRRVLVSIESPTIGRFVVEVDLGWCQFRRQGDYTSGGRFVQLANRSA